jgi:RecG-like helicase
MRVLVESQDGFEIAEKDLALRGQGNLFGLEQHGSFGFRFFDYGRDQALWDQVAKSLGGMDGQELKGYAYLAQDHLDNMKEVRNTGCE